jgi:maltose alpha-D-glucosyltransferase/alpha-amylase
LTDLVQFVEVLGRRTAELHAALCRKTGDPAFDPEPIGAADLTAWSERVMRQVERASEALARSDLPEAQALLARKDDLLRMVEASLPDHIEGVKTRIHGDYHLGQVLVVKADVAIIDFEGEPGRTMEERRGKDSPLRDVAGMLRSFNYAIWHTLFHAEATRPEARQRLGPLAKRIETFATTHFLSAYRAIVVGTHCYPGQESEGNLLRLFLLEKACYEIAYEAAQRPAWLEVPVRGIAELLDLQ